MQIIKYAEQHKYALNKMYFKTFLKHNDIKTKNSSVTVNLNEF